MKKKPLPKEQTEIWECESEKCNGWMRKTSLMKINKSAFIWLKNES